MASVNDGSFGVGYGMGAEGGDWQPSEPSPLVNLHGWPALVVALRAIQRAGFVVELSPKQEDQRATVGLFVDSLRLLEKAVRRGTIPVVTQVALLSRISGFLNKLPDANRIHGAPALVTAIRTLAIVVPTDPPRSGPDQAKVPISVSDAATIAVELVLSSVRNISGEGIRQAIDRDASLLAALVKRPDWDALHPIDPDVCGPLHTTTYPKPSIESLRFDSNAGGMEIELEVPDGTSDKEVADHLSDYLSRLNRLHRAIGGHGLRVTPPIEITQAVPSTTGVCS